MGNRQSYGKAGKTHGDIEEKKDKHEADNAPYSEVTGSI